MAEELEDKYSRFQRNTNIDLLAEIAAGGSGGGLDNYYTKTESDAITDSLDDRLTDVENNPGIGVTDHGALTGLSDDDHTQYLTNVRGDARYYTKAQNDSSLAGKANTSHTHSTNDVNSGVFNIARIPTGTSNVTVSLGNHTHDDRYYTETEVDSLLNNKANTTVTNDLDSRVDTLEATSITDAPRYLKFNSTWPGRPDDDRMTFYIGGSPSTDAPLDSIPGDVWIPTPDDA
jgi:hypothetical protein